MSFDFSKWIKTQDRESILQILKDRKEYLKEDKRNRQVDGYLTPLYKWQLKLCREVLNAQNQREQADLG
jgi:hypothetical protein